MDKQLLIKYIKGDVTDREKAAIAQWLDADPEHMREYLAMHKLHDITLWHDEHAIRKAQRPAKKKSLIYRISIEMVKIAAVIALAFFAFKYYYPQTAGQEPTAMQTLHVPAGQRAQLTLTDGTKVWLNANTTLNFPNRFNQKSRQVQLHGEGYFDVKTDSTLPFYVQTGQYDIKVWGTEFNVMAYPDRHIFETALLKGSVEVMGSGENEGAFIEPHQRIYIKDNKIIRGPITHYNHFLWKDGIISFNDEPFTEMVEKLELYFDLKIEVKNKKILSYRCTGKFRTKDGVEHILKVLQLSNSFNFNIDDKQNLIIIK